MRRNRKGNEAIFRVPATNKHELQTEARGHGMSAKRVSQKVPESGVLRACLDLLAAEKIWHRRWNTGAVKTGKRLFRFGKPGDADILAAPHRSMECCNKVHRFRWIDFLWIECKSDSGKQTADQKAVSY